MNPRHILIKCAYLVVTTGILILSGCDSTPTKPTDSQKGVSYGPAKDLSPLNQTQYANALEKLAGGKAKSAAKSLERLAKTYPNHFGIHLNLGTAHFQAGNIQEAKSRATHAKNLNGKQAAAHNLLGLIAIEERKFSDAKALFESAMKLDKTYADAFYNYGLLHDVYFQDIPAAYNAYLSYLKLRPEDKETQEWVEQLKYSVEN